MGGGGGAGSRTFCHFPPNLEMFKVTPSGRFVLRKLLCKVKKSPGREGGGEGCSPATNSLLDAALGQLITKGRSHIT